MSLQEILAGYKRTSIYDRSNRRFNLNERSQDLTTDHIHLKFIFLAYMNTHNHRSLYNCHEPNTIDEMALDTTRRSSIYQRASITDHLTSLANGFGNYEFFKSGYY